MKVNPCAIMLVSLPSATEKDFEHSKRDVLPMFVLVETQEQNYKAISVKNSNVCYWEILFTYGYYTLANPFRLLWSSKERCYIIYCQKYHKILYLLINAFVFSWMCAITMQYFRSTNIVSPMGYFRLFSMFAGNCYVAIWLQVFWSKHTEIQNAARLVFERRSLIGENRRMLVHVLFFLSKIRIIASFLENFESSGWSWKIYLESRSLLTKNLFRINSTEFSSIAAVTGILGDLLTSAGFSHADMTFFMTALVLYNSISNFCSIVDDEKISVEEVLKRYEELKEISRAINRAMGNISLGFSISIIPYYATHMMDITDENSIFTKLQSLILLSYFSFYVIAAASNKKMDSVKQWLHKRDNYISIHPNQVNVILHELAFHPIGISNGLFTITFGFITSVIGIIITYSIVILQLKGVPVNKTPMAPANGGV